MSGIDAPPPDAPDSPLIIEADLGPAAREAGIRAGFTTRALGNLALDVGADPGRVRPRRAAIAPWAGGPVHFAHHVHGTQILGATAAPPTPAGAGPPQADPTGDAWSAPAPAALGVLAADCLPVLLADPVSGILGAAHAGRVGLLAGVLPATVARMRGQGAREIHAVIGPAICGACYEVSGEIAEAAEAAGGTIVTSRWGTPALDLTATARGQLQRGGVHVHGAAPCTLEDPRFFSHRSRGRAGGQHAGIITSLSAELSKTTSELKYRGVATKPAHGWALRGP